MTTDDKLTAGMRNREAVLGRAHVQRSLDSATDFGRPLQELITEYCWGAIWGRPELSFKMRSLLNIAMLTALGRQHELSLHVRGAITNGCSVSEIREVLLQAAVYCGVPAAIEASRTTEATLGTVLSADQDGDGEARPS